MAGTRPTFKLLVATERDMYDMRTLAKEAHTEQKKNMKLDLQQSTTKTYVSNAAKHGMFKTAKAKEMTTSLQTMIGM